jgi:hypothetical protein
LNMLRRLLELLVQIFDELGLHIGTGGHERFTGSS